MNLLAYRSCSNLLICVVRSEARTLPSVFVAQGDSGNGDEKSSSVRHHLDIEDKMSSAEGRNRGIFSDGVYIALPPEQAAPAADREDQEEGEVAHEEGEFIDPQAFYYGILHQQFRYLRATLKCVPPASAIAALDDKHPISLPEYSRKAIVEWRKLLQSVEPQMVQIACMDVESVLRLLPIVTRSLSASARSGEVARVKRLGAWAWALLGRCTEVGQLSSEEVAEIRELGKRAVKILIKIRSPEMHQALEEAARQGDAATDVLESDDEGLEQSGTATSGTVDEEAGKSQNPAPIEMTDAQEESESLEAAKARLRAKLGLDGASTDEPNQENDIIPDDKVSLPNVEIQELDLHTRAMLDMIITVVGEFFGQRDLLEFRDIWPL